MKIFNAGQIRKWDAATMAAENITQALLMQRAGNVCAQWLKKKFDKSTAFLIACGKGGNGGDGLVIARELLHAGYHLSILLFTPADQFKGATLEHWNKLITEFPDIGPKITVAPQITGLSQLQQNAKAVVIVDALLGTGYTPASNNAAISDIITKLNATGKPVVAVDLPSGLSPDQLPSGQPGHAAIIKATHTLSFQSYKRSFLHAESSGYTGKIHVLDIGLDGAFARAEHSQLHVTGAGTAVSIYRPRSAQPFGHKGSFGTVLLVGGSYGKIGAIGLSARAALRAGAGKVFIQAPKCGYEILQSSIPEAMFEPAGESYVSEITISDKATCGIGPGMDTHPESLNALKALLKQSKAPLVLDADALNIIATDTEKLLALVPKNSILTPHPGEFQRLFGKSEDSLQEVDRAQQQAKKWELVIVLKGHRTAVCTPDGAVRYNLSGNAGMATAGSGDVLTGIITSLLAQGYPPVEAAILGVYLHGLSGDHYVKNNAQESLIAHDLIDGLPKVIRKMENRKNKAG